MHNPTNKQIAYKQHKHGEITQNYHLHVSNSSPNVDPMANQQHLLAINIQRPIQRALSLYL